MKKLILSLVIIVASLFLQTFFTQTANAASADFDCKPSFKGGYYGGRCPPRSKHPEQDKYPGHSYHSISIRLIVTDPSGLDNKTYTDRAYCDCGRGSSKCKITANYTPSSGRSGRFVGPNVNSAAGGSNDGGSSITFNYQLDPLPPYELSAGISKNADTVLPGGVITWTHTATRVSGETTDSIRGESGTQRKGPMVSDNAVDDTKTRLRKADNNVQNSGLPEQMLLDGGIKERTCFILCSESVKNPWSYRDVSNNIYPRSRTLASSNFTSTLTVGKNTPEGTQFCRQTIIDKAKYDGKKSFSASVSGFECVTVKTDATTRYSLTPKIVTGGSVYEPGSGVSVTPFVTNSGPAQSRPTQWEVTRIMLSPGAGLAAKENGGDSTEAPCGNYFRPAATSGTCGTIDSGTSTFTKIDVADKIKDMVSQIDDQPIGTRFCFALSVKPPTQDVATDNTWRHSKMECVTVGKRPKVQIHGGDLMVGRTFSGESVNPLLASIVNTSNVLRDGNTFGSWTEYAISAPGRVTNAASSSGLAGGSSQAGQLGWSKLTFANTPTFGDSGVVGGMIPDITSAIRSNYNTATAPTIRNDFRLTSSTRDIRTANGDVRLSSDHTFGAEGQTLVVYAPNNKVTITSNITYSAGRVNSVNKIPQLIIIANDIQIEGGVERIDGWLIAQGMRGVIDTCADVDTTSPGTGLSATVCDKQLTVNGPVAAKKLLLERTAGSTPGDEAARSAPGELFNLRADAYLWAYGFGNGDRRPVTTYTSELPPRF